jgi:hypothetical protein
MSLSLSVLWSIASSCEVKILQANILSSPLCRHHVERRGVTLRTVYWNRLILVVHKMAAKIAAKVGGHKWLPIDTSSATFCHLPDGCTPVHIAVGRGHEKVVKLLRKSGARMDVVAASVGSPAETASRMGHDAMAEKLTKYTACCACYQRPLRMSRCLSAADA